MVDDAQNRSSRPLRPTDEPPLLLPRIAAGDEGAVRECLLRYARLVYSLARRFLPAADVDDACQEVFLSLWQSAHAYDPDRSSEVTFVAMIARRRLIDRARSAGGRPLPVVERETNVSADAIEHHVDAKNAVAALAECSDEQRRVILLSACHGLSHDQIATELGMPLGTVKSHYTRGIERVRRTLARTEAKP